MPLTDTAIKKLKASDKPMKVSDERGLYLLVNPSGSKLWRWKYRFDGKEKVLPVGQYPDISLAQAREAREDAFWTLILRSPVAILVFAAGAFGLIWAFTGSLMLDLAAVGLFVGVFLFVRHRKRRKSALSSRSRPDPCEHLEGR